jgi:predicted NBD/HSP70 family sugar kinase
MRLTGFSERRREEGVQMDLRVKIRILDAIRLSGGVASKKSIQAATGFAWGTVGKTVDALVEEGILSVQRVAPVGPGRPLTRLEANSNTKILAGLSLGGEAWRLLLCGVCFERLFERSIPTPQWKDGETTCKDLIDFIESSFRAAGIDIGLLAGIGVAVAGNVEPETGVLVSAANMGIKWGANLHVREALERHFKTNVLLVSSQPAVAWAEYMFGSRAGNGNMVTVGIGVGIGAAVIANGELIVSRPDRPTGYIGHFYIPGNRRPCVCGRIGCIESYSGGRSLVAVASERGESPWSSAGELDLAAASGDARAQALMRRAARYDAFGVSMIVQMYRPDVLVFNGRQCRPDGFLFKQLLARLEELLPPAERGHLDISVSSLGDYSPALGAARLCFEGYF